MLYSFSLFLSFSDGSDGQVCKSARELARHFQYQECCTLLVYFFPFLMEVTGKSANLPGNCPSLSVLRMLYCFSLFLSFSDGSDGQVCKSARNLPVTFSIKNAVLF